jgi:hypothetical protein
VKWDHTTMAWWDSGFKSRQLHSTRPERASLMADHFKAESKGMVSNFPLHDDIPFGLALEEASF